jgi:hypothetical protein
VGLRASTLRSPAKLTCWAGTCSEKAKSAEQNKSSRLAKGNKNLRRYLNLAANAAVNKKGSRFPSALRCLLPRLGFQVAVRVLTHRLCRVIWEDSRQGNRSIEQRIESEPFVSRAESMTKKLRKFDYNEITATNTAPIMNAGVDPNPEEVIFKRVAGISDGCWDVALSHSAMRQPYGGRFVPLRDEAARIHLNVDQVVVDAVQQRR